VSAMVVSPKERAHHLERAITAATPRIVALLGGNTALADRVKAVTLGVVARDQRIAECTPESVVRSVLQICEWGLDPSPQRGQAYIVPRSVRTRSGEWQKRAAAQLGYKGALTLAYRSPRLLSVDAVVVRATDDFVVTRGTSPNIHHAYRPNDDRGAVVLLYFAARLTPAEGNVWHVDDMTVDAVNAVRDRSDGWKAFQAHRIKSNPWDSDWDEMAKKTMLIRGLKQCPVGEDTLRAIETDLDDHRGMRRASMDLDAEDVSPSRTDELKTKLGVQTTDVLDADYEEDEGIDADDGAS